jgi:hypothetical protein
MSTNYDYWYEQAIKTSKVIGWLPQVIMSQWIVETAHFTSKNFVNNRNIAGQTWYRGCGFEQGTPRPEKEGGYYIKYPDATSGYIDFINRNTKRYGRVKDFKTPQEQFRAIKDGGWAVDPNYVSNLMSVYKWCVTHNIFKEYEEPKPTKWTSLVDYLKDHHLATDFESRRKLAVQYKVVKSPQEYSGSASQNIALLNKLISVSK